MSREGKVHCTQDHWLTRLCTRPLTNKAMYTRVRLNAPRTHSLAYTPSKFFLTQRTKNKPDMNSPITDVAITYNCRWWDKLKHVYNHKNMYGLGANKKLRYKTLIHYSTLTYIHSCKSSHTLILLYFLKIIVPAGTIKFIARVQFRMGTIWNRHY